ncbi:ABC transporter ATP-binding protein [uncultured Vibrio sp.]|uniref:ABC transporter ATP-binding protein n=1 Tax=uncultured Vibrio sp. TaxID=114054 RepID=UPI0025DB1727|nr:ABC transporter ATP-binding protein [uncultured Vibrio sp.]
MSLTIQKINKKFGDVAALSDIDLSLEQGELAALVGPSGCGKTTLLRSIAGLEQPSSGKIIINNTVVFENDDPVNPAKASISLPTQQRNLGMVFQDFALWPHLTVFENVAFGLRARKQTQNLDQRVSAALDQVQLGQFAKRYPNQLSGGQQQRVSIARAIVMQPQLILLDEPLSALDAVLKDQIQQLLVALLKEHKLTAVYVTHDQSEAMSMADKVMILNQGKVEQFAQPEAIYHQPATEFVAHFIGKNNRLPNGDGRTFVRMEALKFQHSANDNDIRFEAAIKNARFQGQHYLIEADVGGEQWYFCAPQRLQAGQSISLYCAPEHINQIQLQG